MTQNGPLSNPRCTSMEASEENGQNDSGVEATSNTHVEGRNVATWNNYKKTLVDVHWIKLNNL